MKSKEFGEQAALPTMPDNAVHTPTCKDMPCNSERLNVQPNTALCRFPGWGVTGVLSEGLTMM